MPSRDSFRLITKALGVFTAQALVRLVQRLHALQHRYTYRLSSSSSAGGAPHNVVVLGASFAGIQLARRLAETLPSGYRVLVLERNSHFHYVFQFPRFAVVPGHEPGGFIPYTGGALDPATAGPPGILSRVQARVEAVEADAVRLESGERVPFAFLALATGASQPAPARVKATEKPAGCEELRVFQRRIAGAERIAIVGGGPVGVELAGDIKGFFPRKEVVLVHSRAEILPHFGDRLRRYVAGKLEELGVRLLLGERPVVLPEGVDDGVEAQGDDETKGRGLRFKDGRGEWFDLVIPCTGQRPNSGPLASLAPQAIDPRSHRVKVLPTLQLDDPRYPHIFALGDVAETPGPKMGRAGQYQAEIVRKNIVDMIQGKRPVKTYVPCDVEGAIKLTLGKKDWVLYVKEDNGNEIMVHGDDGKEDLDIKHAWKEYGADFDKQVAL